MMKKTIQIAIFTFLFWVAIGAAWAQQKAVNTADIPQKEELYRKYKKEVQSFNKNDFDVLFSEFFKKQKDKSTTLTREEFYTYTIKIAIYSEKLGLLYKDQKEDAQRTKQEWFDKSYTDYLNSKK